MSASLQPPGSTLHTTPAGSEGDAPVRVPPPDMRRWPVSVGLVAVGLTAVHAAQHALGVLDGAALLAWGARSVCHQDELGQWWRLLTGLLLHGSWPHLLGNLLFLLLVGHGVEALLGAAGAAVVLGASGVGGMLVASMLVPTAAAGASPMVFGCFGAAVALGFRFDHLLRAGQRLRFGWALLFALMGFSFFVVLSPGWERAPAADNVSHVAGALVGAVLGFVVPSRHDSSPSRRGIRPWLLSLAGTLLLFCLVLPLAHGFVGAFPVRLADRYTAEEHRVRIEPPSGWIRTDEGGRPTWRSPTGQARLSAWRFRGDGPTSQEGLRSFFRVDLAVHGEPAREVKPPAEEVAALRDGWWAFSAERSLPSGDTRTVRYVESSDDSALVVEFEHGLAAFEAYAPVRRAVLRSVEAVPKR